MHFIYLMIETICDDLHNPLLRVARLDLESNRFPLKYTE